MDFSTNKNGATTVEITVKNTPEEVQEAYHQAYLAARKTFKAPGFRKGKAPLEMVEKQLGESVAGDAAKELIQAVFEAIYDDLDPRPISSPSFDIKSFDRNEGAEFVGVFDVLPDIKLGEYKSIKIVKDEPEVSQETLDAELERIRQQNSILHTREEGEAVAEGDYVTVSIQIHDEGEELYRNDDAGFRQGEVDFPPEINAKLPGLKNGEECTYKTKVADDFSDARYAGKEITVSFTVKQISYPEIPELNDEFAKDLGEFENLDALKAKIREDYTNLTDQVLKNRAMDKLLDVVMESSELEAPASMVESDYKYRLNQIRNRIGRKDMEITDLAAMTGKDADALESELREGATRSVKDRLVLGKIASNESIEVTQEEIEADFIARWSQYLPADRLRDMLKDEDVKEETRSRIEFRKALEWVFDHAKVEAGEKVSYEKLRDEGAFS